MKERGQVFTLDMLFALILVTLVIGYSGQALERISKEGEDYLARYSLEQIANDAADILSRTAGMPLDWEENIRTLETLGLAENIGGNSIDAGKLGSLIDLCRASNWDPTKSEAQAVMGLFGGSEDFEIRLTYRELLARLPLDDLDLEIDTTILGVEISVYAENKGDVIDVEVELKWDKEVVREREKAPEFVLVVEGGGISVEVWVGRGLIDIRTQAVISDFWPGWDVEDSSGVENSLEVAVVRRSVATRFGDVAAESHEVGLGNPGRVFDNLEWVIPSGGLEAFDWYIVVETGAGVERREKAFIFVNREISGKADYEFVSKPDKLEETFPKIHGGIENDLPDPPRTGEIHEGSNYLNLKVTAGNAEAWIKVYVIAVPACSSPETASLAIRILPATLEVLVWR